MFAISADLIFLALQSAQNSVSDFQPKQPGYRYDAVHQELACLQSYHWPELPLVQTKMLDIYRLKSFTFKPHTRLSKQMLDK